jgi:hypothetical protein
METSNTTKELTLALCQFQSSQLKAAKANNNPAFKTKYAGINEVLDAVLPTLTEAGLCFVQFPDGEALTTRLMHTSGEWMQASYALKPSQNTPQASGSALTYARRYALLAVLGLGTEDDDGNAASVPPARTQSPLLSGIQIRERLAAATSTVELRELWEGASEAHRADQKMKDAFSAARARVDAAILEAAGTKA